MVHMEVPHQLPQLEPVHDAVLYWDIASPKLQRSLHGGDDTLACVATDTKTLSTADTQSLYRTGTSFFSAAFFAKGMNSGAPGRY